MNSLPPLHALWVTMGDQGVHEKEEWLAHLVTMVMVPSYFSPSSLSHFLKET